MKTKTEVRYADLIPSPVGALIGVVDEDGVLIFKRESSAEASTP